jgi:fucose 4-O-acetylase-like acetyltransferase
MSPSAAVRRRLPAGSSPPPEKSSANRDPSLDNVRFLAAALVVVGHVLEPIRATSEIASTVYFATWPLRIPVLVVIAGYFSRSTFLDRVQMTSLLRNVLLVYLAFHAISSVEIFLLSGEFSYDPTTPTWGTWFLLSLFCWRVLLPYLSLVRSTPALLVVGALGVGFVDGIGAQFSASRTIVYFPLFLLGHWLGAGGLQWIRALPHARIVAPHLLAALMLTGALLHHRITPLSLHMRDSYGFQQLPALPAWRRSYAWHSSLQPLSPS